MAESGEEEREELSKLKVVRTRQRGQSPSSPFDGKARPQREQVRSKFIDQVRI